MYLWALENFLKQHAHFKVLTRSYLRIVLSPEEASHMCISVFGKRLSRKGNNVVVFQLESRSRGISYMKYVNGRRTGLVTFCVETAFYKGLLKER